MLPGACICAGFHCVYSLPGVLKPAVRQDLRDLKAFYQKYQNPLEPYDPPMYGRYLKANHQPQGINSYDEVVGLAIAYYNKYGAEAF